MDSIAKSQQEQDEQEKEKSSALLVETFYDSGQKLDEDQPNYKEGSLGSEEKPIQDLKQETVDENVFKLDEEFVINMEDKIAENQRHIMSMTTSPLLKNAMKVTNEATRSKDEIKAQLNTYSAP